MALPPARRRRRVADEPAVQLAPISFTNPIDGQRRRRLFALDTWETNNFVWANDNPGDVFPNNHRFIAAHWRRRSSTTELQHGAGHCADPIAGPARQEDQPQLSRCRSPTTPTSRSARSGSANLPALEGTSCRPEPIDTPEELAQLSQYVINIVDFRDPDCTMTHWVNPDVMLRAGLDRRQRGTADGTHDVTT